MQRAISGTVTAFALGAGLGLALPQPVLGDTQKDVDFFVVEDQLPFEPIEGVETTRDWGIHKNAGYRIEVPADWNGDLVMYAHGFRGEGPELTVDSPPIREHLVRNGYAWAASSFSKNFYDVKVGVQDTHALLRLFNGKFGNPNRTYIVGVSMGGHITAKSIEQHRNAYDGAMPLCGVMADTDLWNYFLDFNLVAQALTGFDATFPNPDFDDIRPDIIDALGPDYPTELNESGEQLKAVTENLSGGERPTFDTAFFFWNEIVTEFLFGFGDRDGTVSGMARGNIVDNTDRVYRIEDGGELTEAEQQLNAEVLRVQADPQAVRPNGLSNIPPVRGEPTMPVLSMHTLGDLFVPFVMQQTYAERVEANGLSDYLVQRAIRDVGHCTFDTAEMENGFDDLVAWVENGDRPDGDDVTNPEAVADPDFGCAFTNEDGTGSGLRGLLPACSE